ncbi:activator of 90 kDa heat shock protein ATPase homolog 2 [Macrosteles quadrilineatus]|uniref:activator of 90 kDa heat shock protein ATPase homolog 2 n=1 Tax=Macrosteles quadrilineatus TaxID=74068 RepID=UPI0023E2F3DD|nr:activator of 90 kDa heat shock protein ATPase homolog 2 [Macrosteles quadrilineatus]
MAKWGEGDPRWIVEERPDATNVNNWHWTEKNACAWSQEKLKDLLLGLRIKSDLAEVWLTEMEKIEGEAVANNRKGKLIFFYEWDMTITWKGRLNGADFKEVEGKINIPNLSEENDVSEVDITVSLKESTSEGDIIKEFLYHQGKERIREKLEEYVVSLKKEFSKGMILPKKEDQSSQDKQISNLSSGFNKKVQVNQSNNTSGSKGVKIETSTVKMTVMFQCTGTELYRALTVPEMVMAFTSGPVKLETKKLGKFELFGGNIHGEFVELEEDKKIVQRWRSKRWPDEHYSTVTMDISQKQDHTELTLTQTSVPKSDAEATKENWSRYYWDPIKRTFSFGSFL